MTGSAEIEAAYRFFNNPRVEFPSLVAPHVSESWRRAAASSSAGWVLSVEDTTELRFGGTTPRQGLGALMNDGQGFYAHVGLLACLVQSDEPGGTPVPLGVGGSEFVVRPVEPAPKRKKLTKKQLERERHFAEDNEALRWERVAEEIERSGAAAEVSVVHVADREGDKYPWLAQLVERGQRFVIRQTHNRRLAADEQQQGKYLNDLLSESSPILATRRVSFETVVTRGGRRRRTNARQGRETRLEVRATTATIRRPKVCRSDRPELTLNLVQVREADPPAGVEPIEWQLLTTEPIATEQDVLRVVDAYRARWLIEEFFKAIKTGCHYEQLQFQHLHALQNALAVCMALAWQMLLLRTIARDAPHTPAAAVVTDEQLAILIALAATKNPWSMSLPSHPNARDISFAIARMGGHFKHNGPPGWLTLARGFQELERVLLVQRLLGGEM